MSIVKLFLYLLAYIFHRNHDSKVIYYHDISSDYTDMGTNFTLFQKHVMIIRESGYQIVPMIENRQDEIMFCFDDGWEGIYNYRDFFVEQRIFPTIFIAVSLIGTAGYLTIDQIKELANLGFNFECHSWTHKNLTSFDDEGLVHELIDSKNWLEKNFGQPFNSICYPQGRFSIKVYDKCKEAGYKRQYSSLPGGFYDNDFVICRNCAQFSSPKEFKYMLNSTSHFFKARLFKQQFVGNIEDGHIFN